MKLGAPKKGESRPKSKMMSFMVDPETQAQIKALEDAMPVDIQIGRRSEAIRKAIHEAFTRLTKEVVEQGENGQ